MVCIGDVALTLFSKLVKQAEITGKLWEDAHFILADVPLKVGEAKKILPWGLKPADPPLATLFVSDYRRTGFTVPYREAAVLVHVKTMFGTGVHCCWMPVDDDTALIYGRELLGYPKKMARIDFEEDEKGIEAGVTRRGVKVLSLRGKRGRPQAAPPPVFDLKTFNVGGMGQLFAFNPVWMLRPMEVIHEAYEAEVEVEIEDSEHDPLARFLEPAAVAGRMAVIDILGSKYMWPVGLAGVRWLSRTFGMRTR